MGVSSMQGLSPSQAQEELYRGQECEPSQLPLLLPQTQQGSTNLCKSGSAAAAAPVLSGAHSN